MLLFWYNYPYKTTPASGLTLPGNDDQPVKATGRKEDSISSPFVSQVAKRDDTMNNPGFAIQGEIFPPESKYSSQHAINKKRLEIAKQNKKPDITGRQGIDMTGVRIGLIFVVGKTGEKYRGHPVWECRCDCGSTIKALTEHLRRDKPPFDHCGCLGVDKSGKSKPGTRGLQFDRRKANNPAASFNILFANYANVAASRGYEWQLTKRQFGDLTKGNCHYCGVEPSQEYKQNGNTYIYNGVDRLDSSKGYYPDNCVSCCGECNMAKGDRPVDDFLAWVERVHNFLSMA